MNPANTSPWHALPIDEALRRLHSDAARGLSTGAAEAKLAEYGRNELQERPGRSALSILVDQFRGPMILLLASAAIISAVLHEFVDAVAILAIIILNAILGFFQDFRAERAMAALKRFSVPIVRAHRDGALREISAAELVPGDVVELETGNRVPADCRLLQTANLEIDEAPLTGESESVQKQIEAFDDDERLPVADRRNMAYLGTTVSYGHGIGLVTATGMATELGRIADSLQTVKPAPSPLQRRLGGLGRTLAIVAIGIVMLLFVVGLLLGESPRLMLMTALSLAVAIVPEGLPAVATVTLALGARRMARRNALIRRLPAVESLGSVTVICSDKTGTLTENRMAVTVLDVADGRRSLTSERCDPGQQDAGDLGHSLLLAAATLCNDSQLQETGDSEEISAIGEPTEAAIVVAAAKCGLAKDKLDRCCPRIDEIPFDSDRKCMTTVHDRPSNVKEDSFQSLCNSLEPPSESARLVCTKGAVDALLERSAYVWAGGAAIPLDEEWQQRILKAHNELASDGMRVLAAGCRWTEGDVEDRESWEHGLIFIGLLAMIDPPRQEAKESVDRCRSAGIRPVMITGDHALTAQAIARNLGISTDVRTGEVVSQVASGQWDHAASVFARVSPHDKLDIVKTLQADGEIVAMTGDGVNDAPAIKQADIGVAMGRIGTDVAREAADMVLLDDDFSTIVNAVEEGRVVFDNIRKFVKYTMTSNAGELFVMFFGPLLGMPLPLLPLQILWINLVTDGLPGLALAVEPAEPGTMQRPPIPPHHPIFDREMVRDIVWIGLLMAAASLAMGYWEWTGDPDNDAHWRTIVFTVLTISQMGNALATRSRSKPLFQAGIFSNKPMLASVLLTLGLQLAVIYWRPLQDVFRTVSLSGMDLVLCAGLGSVVFLAVETVKLIAPANPPGAAS